MAERRLPLAAALLVLSSLPVAAEDFVCRGRDPAWDLSGRGAQAVLSPDKGARRTLTGVASNLPAEGVVVWRGRSGDGQPDVVAVMIKGACTDPAAGEASGYLGILSLPNAAPAVGCCNYGGRSPLVAEAPPAPPPVLAQAAVPPPRAEQRDVRPAKPVAEAKLAAAAKPPPRSLAPGASVMVAGSAKQKSSLRAKPAEGARIVGRLAGGRAVVVQEVAQRDGAAWYRVKGKGVPAVAWIRGDLLAAR